MNLDRREFITAAASLSLIAADTLSTNATEHIMTQIKPFHVSIPDKQIADLKLRLQHTRWPDEPENSGWSLGTNLAYMKSFSDYWASSYDWSKAEAEINALPNFKATIDQIDLHFIHYPSKNKAATPLLLLHGWPDSFYRYHKVIAPLSEDFHVVVPSMPGTGFSGHTALPIDKIGDIYAKLMSEVLGYPKFIAAGGDGGSNVAMSLAQRHPEHLLGYHVTDVGYPDQHTDFAALSQPEQAYAGAIQKWFFTNGAFSILQATKPQSLGFAINDSPAGLAAWIMSFMAGMGVGDNADKRFGRDALITNIMIYWLTETAVSSFRLYSQSAMQPPTITGKNTKVPVAVATEVPIPGGVRMPREWADRQTSGNVVQFHDMATAGHFAAWEDPAFFIKDLREFDTLLKN
jgi:pimeloyl-ACP methyl ester carboxylesterase